MSWEPFGGGDAAWDALLEPLRAPVYQSSLWARHKAGAGWTPLRARTADGSAAVQVLARRRGPACLLWARGGPVGEPTAWDASMRTLLTAMAGAPLVYARLCPYRETSPALQAALASAGFARAARPLDRNASFVLDLRPTPEALEAALSSNWGHNLRRGRKRASVRPWADPDPRQVLSLYRAMESYKGISPLHGDSDFASQLEAMGGRLAAVRADAPDGTPLALRAAAVFGSTAWDLLAATTPQGRRCYASYAAFWALALEARARGAAAFELGGADPEKAKGVYDFKKGTGAAPVQYLGEWHWASPGGAAPLADAALALLRHRAA